jgi:DNA-directed RNA polymerase specialized sigma24 family protein
MRTGSNCDCLVCRLEKSIIAELGAETTGGEHAIFAREAADLARFGTALDLVRELHTPDDSTETASADTLLRELLDQRSRTPLPSIWQQILLLVFIPTIHRTASQVTAMFSSLERDDASQHVLTAFLEFLGSSELRTRRSHLAFTIARKLRRQAFRWAIREARGAAVEDPDPLADADGEQTGAEEPLYAEVALRTFLENCAKLGWLSIEERELLVHFKLDGVSCQEIAGRNGHAAEAVRHRIHRLVERLRRLARRTRWERAPEQLELFPQTSTTEKIFY